MGTTQGKHDRLTIGVVAGWQVYSGTLDSFLGHVFRGIQAAARDRGCNLLLACGVGPPRDFSQQKPAGPFLAAGADFVPVGPWNTDGLIFMSPPALEAGEHYFASLVAGGFPMIYAGDRDRGPAIVVDNEQGIQEALRHLADHGHRAIAFIAGHPQLAQGDCALRLRAYQEGVRKLGLEDDPRLVVFGSHSYDGGRQALRRLLERRVRFSAVLASNDLSALGAMDELHAAGLAVPRDVAVIGFDDRLEARGQTPPLTTVHYPMFELGYQALEWLLRVIAGHQAPAEPIRIPTRLTIRESCGCLPGAFAGSGLPLAEAMTAAIYNESHWLKLQEVAELSRRLLAACAQALTCNDPAIFLQVLRPIVAQVSVSGDDLHGWQAALSVLRSHLPVLARQAATALSAQQMEDMFHQARMIISAAARGGATRRLIHQAQMADQVGLMTSEFFATQDQEEILHSLVTNLPSIGIRHAAVVYYEAEGDDPVAWGVLQTPLGSADTPRRFPSRTFPPPGLYPDERPFSLALLPLKIQEALWGFVAFDAEVLEPCADIVRQLGAALRGVQLYREAVEARRLAEEGRRLAEEANRLKSRFLSTVSHELRAPLNVISGLSHMLLKESGSDAPQRLLTLQEDLETIYISAQHLDALIRDVLDLASSDMGRLRLSCEPLDMREVIEAVAAIGRKLAHDKGLAWRIAMPAYLPRVWGDRTRLRQVILNLIGNAVKFTVSGAITLSATVENRQVRISVSDTGLGIPPHEQEAIFDEFRQSERTAARGYGGLGLGLAICKRLIEMHGGHIGVYSSGEEGRGSTFYFSLPIMEGDVPGVSLGVESPRAQRILLLVKDAEKGALVKADLLQHGVEAQIYPVDGETDWPTCLLHALPDAVALDFGLAAEQGWEILRAIKENPATRDLPVLFYALENPAGRGSLLEIDYLTKPIGVSALNDILRAQGLLDRPAGEGKAQTILVVDDEPETLDLHARIIQDQLPECRVLRARDGREALKLIRQERPGLILLDLLMPEMDGFAVLEAMHQEESLWHIPVIVVTGQALTTEDMARLNWGVVSVLEKGVFTVEETLAHVASVLAHKRRAGSESQRIVRKAMAYIHAHYTEPIARRDVAAYVGLSERHLTRSFHREVGITLNAYLNRYRLHRARLLLEAGAKNITEVALAVGFSSSSYFARVFREEMGVSPRAYLAGR